MKPGGVAPTAPDVLATLDQDAATFLTSRLVEVRRVNQTGGSGSLPQFFAFAFFDRKVGVVGEAARFLFGGR